MPPKAVLVVENSFIETGKNNNELNITVYDRVFNKLVKQNSSLGKICPLYIKVNNSHKIFGIVTLNKSGSYSFFPEFPSGLQFDHMTFVKEFQGAHHYTAITEDGREKVLPILAESLTNELYHVVSFMFENVNLLKDTPKEVIYPEINSDKLHEIENAFFTNGKQEGSTILELKNGTGAICIQFFLIPKGVDYKNMLPFPGPYTKFQKDFEIKAGGIINYFNAVIPHEYQDNYMLGIVILLYEGKVDHPVLIATVASKNGFYSKIDITYKK